MKRPDIKSFLFERMDFIYVLTCPKSGEVRYVGKTRNPKQRLGTHVSAARAGAKHWNARWIASLDASGLFPGFSVVHTVGADSMWQVMERFFIAACRNMGMRLTNGTDGGEGVSLLPENEARVKALRKAGITPEVIAKRADGIRKSWERPDIRAKRIAAFQVAASTPEAQERLSRIARMPRSDEAKKRQREGMIAYYANPENKARRIAQMRERGLLKMAPGQK
jgi:hypothetical protein